MQLEESQLILFDLQQSVGEIAELSYVVGEESVYFILFAEECGKSSKVIIFS